MDMARGRNTEIREE